MTSDSSIPFFDSGSTELNQLESLIDYKFKQRGLLLQAVTHRSFHSENKSLSVGDNERLEFLGDAVLDLVVSHELMRLYPTESEGVLSKWRASLVNEARLAELALTINLNPFLRLGRGELLSQASARPRIMSSALEAVVGAMFLDGGYIAASTFVARLFEPVLRSVSATTEFEGDYKTRLQEMIQKETHAPPDYRIVRTEGPDHNKTFFVEVSVQGQVLATASGLSRKSAEQQAAKIALEQKEKK